MTALEDRMNSVVAELRSRMEADLAETTSSADLLRHDYSMIMWIEMLTRIMEKIWSKSG